MLIHISEHGDQAVEVCVTDTGFGIPPEHLPRIFDRLYRVDSARSQHPNSAGLGLAIVKSIMTLHEGTVEAKSEVGQGTRVRLVFPAVAGRGAHQPGYFASFAGLKA